MKKQRRKFSKEFKLQVVLEALKERMTLNEPGKQGLLPPNLVTFLNERSTRHILEFDGNLTVL